MKTLYIFVEEFDTFYNDIYTITEILRALGLVDLCHLLEYRHTDDVTSWCDSRALSEFIVQVSLSAKFFKTCDQNNKRNAAQL